MRGFPLGVLIDFTAFRQNWEAVRVAFDASSRESQRAAAHSRLWSLFIGELAPLAARIVDALGGADYMRELGDLPEPENAGLSEPGLRFLVWAARAGDPRRFGRNKRYPKVIETWVSDCLVRERAESTAWAGDTQWLESARDGLDFLLHVHVENHLLPLEPLANPDVTELTREEYGRIRGLAIELRDNLRLCKQVADLGAPTNGLLADFDRPLDKLLRALRQNRLIHCDGDRRPDSYRCPALKGIEMLVSALGQLYGELRAGWPEPSNANVSRRQDGSLDIRLSVSMLPPKLGPFDCVAYFETAVEMLPPVEEVFAVEAPSAPAVEADSGEWVGPFTTAELAKRFSRSPRTINRRIENGDIRVRRQGGHDYLVHKDDMPAKD